MNEFIQTYPREMQITSSSISRVEGEENLYKINYNVINVEGHNKTQIVLEKANENTLVFESTNPIDENNEQLLYFDGDLVGYTVTIKL
jgi:hypothetical protein